ncbi:MAG: DUF5320 domain-containing protein [Firmicutes bacterium]|nr:DUF5320 domain-containing protein [Bacillota bacterium]
MPRGDGTGPLGMGPRTGRGLGYCAGFSLPGYLNGGLGIRWGRRRGLGLGFGLGLGRGLLWAAMQNWPVFRPFWGGGFATDTTMAEQERAILENEVNFLKTQIKQMEKRLAELRARKEDLGAEESAEQ